MSSGIVKLYTDDCTECLQARRYLEEHRVAVDERDVIADALTAREILEVAEGTTDIAELVHPPLRDEVVGMEDEDVAGYLATDPHRLAHPIVDDGDRVRVGYTPDLRAAFSS